MRASGIARRRSLVAGRAVLAALAFVLASDIRPGLAQAVTPAETAVFTIIVTRHGVRAISPLTKSPPTAATEVGSAGPHYVWPSWSPVGDDELTGHGYRLIRLMGEFYRDRQRDKNLPVDCPAKTAYVYADTATRTLATARGLIEGLCGSPDAIEVFHTADTRDKDPIFDATSRLWQLHRMHRAQSRAAVAAVAGSPLSSPVMRHADDFATFQGLLDRRCSGSGCSPIVSAASAIETGTLAGLGGPIATASTYAEDIFLEFAQCRPEDEIARLDGAQLRAAIAAGMRLHVLDYDINARNAYNPLVRAGTLIAHVAAMLDQKAGRTEALRHVGAPDLAGKTLVVVSGHDTQLGALGGILDAHWNPGNGLVRDDMPPGSALVFDLVRGPNGDYGVRLRFAAMALDQYRTEKPIDGGIKFTAVTYTGCPEGGCVMPLTQLESLALTLVAQGLVVDGWDASPSPLPLALLADPDWTKAECRGR
jgi:4-phytase/acid phosphatase